MDFTLNSFPEEPTVELWNKIALMIDGYKLMPQLGLGDWGDFANKRREEYRRTGAWQGSVIELWIYMFFEQRRFRHYGYEPRGQEWDDIKALYKAWRKAMLGSLAETAGKE